MMNIRIDRGRCVGALMAFLISYLIPGIAACADAPGAGAGVQAHRDDHRGRLPAAYIAPMSHLDLTFMGTVEECLSRSGKIFAGALDLCEKYPDFRYLIECGIFLEAYRSAHPDQAARLDEQIRAGRIELGAEWSGLYVIQEDEEDLIRNILIAKRYARDRYGLELETLQLTDIPGVVPQLPQLCSGLGISNVVLTRCAPADTLFWFEAPGGERVLTWSSKGYNHAFDYNAHISADAMRKRGLNEALDRAAKAGVPPLFYYGSDEWLPPPDLVPAVRQWNDTEAARKIAVVTPTEYFRAVMASGVAARAPVLKGELPSTWPYLEPAHVHVSRWDAVATAALDTAERLSSLAWLNVGLRYPREELDAIWRSQLLARDHNYGGQGAGGGHPRKFAERKAVQLRSEVLSSRAMAAIAEKIEVPRESVPIVVFNVLNWARSECVRAHVSSYSAAGATGRDIIPRGGAMVLRDASGQSVPFQITADRRETLGEFDLAFVARDVPALGYAAYTLEPTNATEVASMDAGTAGAPRIIRRVWFESQPSEVVLENNLVGVSIDCGTGLASIRRKGAILAKGLGLVGREELPEVCRRPPLGLSVDDPARERILPFEPDGTSAVRDIEEGPVSASVIVRGSVMGTPAEIRYSIGRGLPWVEVEVRIDWDIRDFGRIEFTYDVPHEGARAAYGLPFGAGAFESENLMPGSGPRGGDEGSRESWERTREISRWLDLGDNDRGIAMTTSHRWTRADGIDGGISIRCCLLRGGRMRPLDPMAEGPGRRTGLVFNFRFHPHGGSWQTAKVPRLGWEGARPLLAYTVNDTWSPKSLPRAGSIATISRCGGKGDALLTCLKQAEDGGGLVARWYEANGESCDVRIAMSRASNKIIRADLQERALDQGTAAADLIATPAWKIITIRAQQERQP